jgi:hypothetical protein
VYRRLSFLDIRNSSFWQQRALGCKSVSVDWIVISGFMDLELLPDELPSHGKREFVHFDAVRHLCALDCQNASVLLRLCGGYISRNWVVCFRVALCNCGSVIFVLGHDYVLVNALIIKCIGKNSEQTHF